MLHRSMCLLEMLPCVSTPLPVQLVEHLQQQLQKKQKELLDYQKAFKIMVKAGTPALCLTA